MRLTPDQRATVAHRIATFPAVVVLDTKAQGPSSVPVRYVLVTPGETGYVPLRDLDNRTLAEVEAAVVAHYNTRPATPEEREAAYAGSLFGWHVPAADPARYAGRVGALKA